MLFIKVAPGEAITDERIKEIKEEWEDGRLSLQSVYDLFEPSPLGESPFINIKIFMHNNEAGEDEFRIASAANDTWDVNVRGIGRLSNKMGFYVKIKPGSECYGGDPNILTKLENLMNEQHKDKLSPGVVKDALGIDFKDIFGIPKENDSSSTSIIGIKWSVFPRPGRLKREKKGDKNKDKKFEGPIQINFKKDDISSSIRIYNSGKIIAVNLPIEWNNKLDEVLANLINTSDEEDELVAVNIDKMGNLLLALHNAYPDIQAPRIEYKEDDEGVKKRKFISDFKIIPQITFITVLHGEIYYNKEKIILNLNKVEEELKEDEEKLIVPLHGNKDRLIVKWEENNLKISLQIYSKNFADKKDKKAIAQIDISIKKDNNDIPISNLEPEGADVIKIKNGCSKYI